MESQSKDCREAFDHRATTAAPQVRPVSIAHGLVNFALVVWAWGLVLYFLVREGALPLSLLCQKLSWVCGLLPGFLVNAETTGAVPIIFHSLFTEDWHWWWANAPWSALAIAAAMATGYWLLGALLLDSMEHAMTPLGRHALALALGMGVAGVAFELVTLAHLLYQPVVVVVWAVLLGGAAVLRWLRPRWYLGKLAVSESWKQHEKRKELALEYYSRKLVVPLKTRSARIYWVACWVAIVVISGLTLLHGIGLPETYWDSLILYVGYARKIFLQHAFPTKVVGQVGIGLGANYPHLYPILTAQTATLAGFWHDAFAQLLPPLAGLASCLLLYALLEEMTRDRLLAVSAVLLFRAVPYGIAYFQYASDYAIAILFTSAFLYCAAQYLRTGLRGPLVLMWMFAAFAVHINYLMWVLWPVALLATLLAHVKGGSCEGHGEEPRRRYRCHSNANDPDSLVGELEDYLPPDERAWRQLNIGMRPSVAQPLKSRSFLVLLLGALAVASPWYIRNVIVTGNPVYAFFYNVFPSKHVNPAVMKSAEVEWRLNGDGLGRVGRTVGEKLRNSWFYFVTGPHHWKLGPVFMAFVIPGVLLFGARVVSHSVAQGVSRIRGQCNVSILPSMWDDTLKMGAIAALLFFLLWFYAYAVADMYLYQIIIVLPLFAIFAAFVFERFPAARARVPLYLLVLTIGIIPGFTMGLMGFKLKRSSGPNDVMQFSQVTLTALRNLFIDRETFYQMEFDGDMMMLRQVNALPPGTRILTHENRHLLLNEELHIVHLDDWEVQTAYGKSAAERVKVLDGLGIQYYLYVPNEDKHRANSWLGMDELIGEGYFEEVFRTPSAGASFREGLRYRHIPENTNVLYRRTSKKP